MIIDVSWNSDLTFVLSQVFMFAAFCALTISFVTKNRRVLLTLNLTQIIFGCISHVFLGAWTAVAMALVAAFRNIAFLIHDKTSGKSDKITIFDHIILAIVLVISGIVSIFIFDGFLSLFSIFGTVISSIAVYQKDIKIFRILGIPTEMLWIVYEIYIGSLIGMLMESLLLGVVIASLIFYKQINNLTRENETLKLQLNTK